LLDLELDGLVLEEATATVTGDLRVVNEDVGPCVLLDEPPALLVVEPLHFAHCHRMPPTSTLRTATAVLLRTGTTYERSKAVVNLESAIFCRVQITVDLRNFSSTRIGGQPLERRKNPAIS